MVESKEDYTRMYKHNCNRCKYLGIYQNADLYCCLDSFKTNNPTLVARFSDDPPNYSSSRKSELEYWKNDDFLIEAEKRAIDQGYITKQVKGDDEMYIPVDNFKDSKLKHYDENMTLKEYIRDNKDRTKDIPRTKLGLVQAFKIDPEWFNPQCADVNLQKTKPFVVIVHSKARPGVDEFDLEKAEDVTFSKCDFVVEVLSGQKQRRQKHIDDMPSKKILDYYKDMYDRSRRYYKDCDEIIQYHEVFDYVKVSDSDFEEEDDSKILFNCELHEF